MVQQVKVDVGFINDIMTGAYHLYNSQALESLENKHIHLDLNKPAQRRRRLGYHGNYTTYSCINTYSISAAFHSTSKRTSWYLEISIHTLLVPANLKEIASNIVCTGDAVGVTFPSPHFVKSSTNEGLLVSKTSSIQNKLQKNSNKPVHTYLGTNVQELTAPFRQMSDKCHLKNECPG